MKNFYCSLVSVLGSRLIYQNQREQGAEVLGDAGEVGSATTPEEIEDRGVKETENAKGYLDSLELSLSEGLKAIRTAIKESPLGLLAPDKRDNRIDYEQSKLGAEWFIKVGMEEQRKIIDRLARMSHLDIDPNASGSLSTVKVLGDVIHLEVANANAPKDGYSPYIKETVDIRPDGTFVRLAEKPDGKIVTFDSRTTIGKKVYTLSKGKKAPDEF